MTTIMYEKTPEIVELKFDQSPYKLIKTLNIICLTYYLNIDKEIDAELDVAFKKVSKDQIKKEHLFHSQN